MKITKNNSFFFDLNTKFEDRNQITQIGAVHAASGDKFNKYPKDKRAASSAVKAFIKWLKDVNDGKPVVLIGHNVFSFDQDVLVTVAGKNNIPISSGVVAGYADSLPAFKKNFDIKKYSMTELAKTLEIGRDSHDALKDAILLKKITMKALQIRKMTMNAFLEDAFRSNE